MILANLPSVFSSLSLLALCLSLVGLFFALLAAWMLWRELAISTAKRFATRAWQSLESKANWKWILSHTARVSLIVFAFAMGYLTGRIQYRRIQSGQDIRLTRVDALYRINHSVQGSR